MARTNANNVEYLCTRLHGRHARMAEAERLDGLCGLRELPELAQEVSPGATPVAAAAIQRRLVESLAEEVAGLLPHLAGAGADLVEWMLVRFHVENLKVLIRGFLSGIPLAALETQLVSLPKILALDVRVLAGAGSLEELVKRLPAGVVRESLARAVRTCRDQRSPFFFEARLDAGYYRELLARGKRLPSDERDVVEPLLQQEVDAFHLELVARGRFLYGLKPESLLPLHVPGAGIRQARFAMMLADADLTTAAARALGRALDILPTAARKAGEEALPIEPADLEPLVRDRFWRLARRAFRRSHMGVGAVAGYVALRRIEVANLVTLSEGIRIGLPEEGIRGLMIPRHHREAVHV